MMNWKEQFDKKYEDLTGWKVGEDPGAEEIKTLVQSQFAELIDSIPDEIYTTLTKEHAGFYDWVDTRTLKNNLKSKWL
jgi:uncharacterized protein CbrC (UPF0167 family)